MVSALTMTKLCKDPGTPTFMISMANLIPLQATATDTLDSILAKYRNFCNIFSEEKAGTLTPHRPYDLQINVKEGAKPVHGPIYSLSPPELLVIYEAFKSWHHYLEGSAKTINMVMDHKNLEYFTTTKKLTRQQARWSEFLSHFNLSIRF